MKQVSIRLADTPGVKLEDVPKRRGNRTTRIPEILEAAINVLARCGYAGFTQRRVANEVGIHMATLQHYFTT
jgi:AcrR family transcriptional regulator